MPNIKSVTKVPGSNVPKFEHDAAPAGGKKSSGQRFRDSDEGGFFRAGQRAGKSSGSGDATSGSRRGKRAPTSSSPRRSRSRSVGSHSKSTLKRTFLYNRHSLIVAMVASMGLLTIDQLSTGDTPIPSQYVAAFILYLGLAGVSELGPRAEEIANALAWLAFLTLLVRKGPAPWYSLLQTLQSIAGVQTQGSQGVQTTVGMMAGG